MSSAASFQAESSNGGQEYTQSFSAYFEEMLKTAFGEEHPTNLL